LLYYIAATSLQLPGDILRAITLEIGQLYNLPAFRRKVVYLPEQLTENFRIDELVFEIGVFFQTFYEKTYYFLLHQLLVLKTGKVVHAAITGGPIQKGFDAGEVVKPRPGTPALDKRSGSDILGRQACPDQVIGKHIHSVIVPMENMVKVTQTPLPEPANQKILG
jgi:hypothetical protein